jgi:broad specificity phosphatase PhoE
MERESYKKDKLLILTRHGERSDYAGLPSILHKCDPELTKTGCEQAFEIGTTISEEIIKRKIKGKILILSSPFSRTLQTSKYILKALYENLDKKDIIIHNKILVDNRLCEYIDKSLINSELPKDYLAVYINNQFIENEFKVIQIEFVNDKDTLPKSVESSSECFDRLKECLVSNIENILSEEDIGVVIFISHGTPIDHMNRILGYLGPFGFKNISYCKSFFYSVDVLTGKTKFLDQKELFKKDYK